MEAVILDGLSAGILTVVLCTSGIASPLRRLPLLRTLLACAFCTSFWCSLLHDPSTTVLATMGIANLTIMLTHWSMTTYSNEEDTNETIA
jgi:hypothetical protein